VIHATGWRGLAALAEAGGRPAGNGVKGQAALLRLDRRGAPQVYAGGLHVVPHGDGTVAVGSTSERAFDDPSATDAGLDDVIARARAAVPALARAPVIARWAGVRPRARSRGPVMGPWPGRPGHWIANGGFKIGFGLAPLAGETMADLVLEGRDRVPEGCGTAHLAPWGGAA
jgi:glycine/D-amino acid oxidase-like deaminating enzyme